MKTRRRTETTTETHEMTVIRFGGRPTMIFCESCKANTLHVSIVQALSMLPLSEKAISGLADDKQIHTTQNPDGSLMLCGNSLALQPLDR